MRSAPPTEQTMLLVHPNRGVNCYRVAHAYRPLPRPFHMRPGGLRPLRMDWSPLRKLYPDARRQAEPRSQSPSGEVKHPARHRACSPQS
jgi:hypothetical protein